jgi:hypothetical protein
MSATAPVNQFLVSQSLQSLAFVRQLQTSIERNSAVSVAFDPQLPVHFLAFPSVGALYVSPESAADTSEEALMDNLAALLHCEFGFVLWHADWSAANQNMFEAVQLNIVLNDWRNVHLLRVCSTHEVVTFAAKLAQFGSMRRVADDKWIRSLLHVADAASVPLAERPPLTDAEQAELVSFLCQIPRVGETSAKALLEKVASLAAMSKMDEKQLTALGVVSAAQAAEVVRFFRTRVTE